MNREEFNFELENNKELLVDFWAEWCGPCRALEPMLHQLSEETGIEVLKVNIDESPELAASEGIQSIPFVKLYQDGVLLAISVGAKPLSALRKDLGL